MTFSILRHFYYFFVDLQYLFCVESLNAWPASRLVWGEVRMKTVTKGLPSFALVDGIIVYKSFINKPHSDTIIMHAVLLLTSTSTVHQVPGNRLVWGEIRMKTVTKAFQPALLVVYFVFLFFIGSLTDE